MKILDAARDAVSRFAARGLARDAAGLAGCAMIAAGAGEIYRPAGLISGGLMLVVGALATAKKPA